LTLLLRNRKPFTPGSPRTAAKPRPAGAAILIVDVGGGTTDFS
jgi:hypothetical protein